MKKKLTELKRFEVARLVEIKSSDVIAQKLTKLGLFNGSEIELISKLPFKGPVTISVHGSKIAIRYDDAENIEVEVNN